MTIENAKNYGGLHLPNCFANFFFQYLQQHQLSGTLPIRRVITGKVPVRRVTTGKLPVRKVITSKLPLRRVITGNCPVRGGGGS